MIQLDILGRSFSAPENSIARLRDLAAAQAGRSASDRDLSLVLDRALKTGAHVVLHRGEARSFLSLLAVETNDAELAELGQTIRDALGDS